MAAFSATKTASATITFANGVTLKINGATNSGEADVLGTSAANLNWTIVKGAENVTTGSVLNETGDNNISLSAISFDVTGPNSGTVYVAIKPNVAWTKAADSTSGSETITPVSENPAWTAVGQTGYYQKAITLDANGSATSNSFTNAIAIFTSGTNDANTWAGRSYEATLKVKASTTQYTAETVVAGDTP